MATYDDLVATFTRFGLEKECERLGLPSKGKKSQLARRIAAIMTNDDGVQQNLVEKDGLRNKDDAEFSSDDDVEQNDGAHGGVSDRDESDFPGFPTTAGDNDGESQDDECFLNKNAPTKPRKTSNHSPPNSSRKKTSNNTKRDDNDDKNQHSDDDEDEDDDDDDYEKFLMIKKQRKRKTSTPENYEAPRDVRIFNFRDIEDSLEKFNGNKNQDIHAWIAEFEEVAKMAGWTPQQKILICRKMMQGTARNFIFAQKCVSSWLGMKKMLIEEFGKKISVAEIHRRLANRTKKKDETYMDYVYEMQRIAKMGDLDDTTICEYICDGVPGDAMNKINLYEAETLKVLKNRLERYEKQMDKFQKTNKINSSDRKYDEKSQIFKNECTLRCYNCGERGHRSEECPHKDRGMKCFNCGSFGHHSKNCYKKNDIEDVKKETKPVKKNIAAINTINEESCDKFQVIVKIENESVSAQIDTGSDVCVIREDLLEIICSNDTNIEQTSVELCGFGGNFEKSRGKVTLDFSIDGKAFNWEFHIAARTAMKKLMLIGTDFLMTMNHSINQGQVRIHPQETSVDDPVTEIVQNTKDVNQDDDSEDQDWVLKIDLQEDEFDGSRENKTTTKTRCQEDEQLMKIVEQKFRSELNEEGCEVKEFAKRKIEKISKEKRKLYNLQRVPVQKDNAEDIVVTKRARIGSGLELKPWFLGPYRIEEQIVEDSRESRVATRGSGLSRSGRVGSEK